MNAHVIPPHIDEPGLTRTDFSRGWVGRVSYIIFHFRALLLGLGILITFALGYSATGLRVDANFEKMIPLHHEYMKTLLDYRSTFGGADKIVVALHNRNGDIFDKDFMNTVRQVSEEVFFTGGVERTSVTSLFSSNVRYNEVVEDGFRGGPIVESNFSGTPEQLESVRSNLLKSDLIGRLVSNDMHSALVVASLLGGKVDLQEVARRLEEIRIRHNSDKVDIHIIGLRIPTRSGHPFRFDSGH